MLNQEFQASGFIAQCIFSINNHNKAVCHQRSALKSMETWRQMGAYTQHWGQWAWLGLYTLNDHFIKCIWLGSIWLDPFFFFPQNCFNSQWHRFSKLLETFLWDSGPYWHESITQFLQICWLCFHDANLMFDHFQKLIYWIFGRKR